MKEVTLNSLFGGNQDLTNKDDITTQALLKMVNIQRTLEIFTLNC